MINFILGVKKICPKFFGYRTNRARKEEIVMLCSQHGVEIKMDLNVASEGLNQQWGKRAKCRACEGKCIKKEIAKFLLETKFRGHFLVGGM